MNRRTLLQEINDTTRSIGSPTPTFASNSPFDSSLALTILVLLTVLFFMAFFSLYIRRFSNNNNSGDTVTRRRQPPPHFRTDKRGGLEERDGETDPLLFLHCTLICSTILLITDECVAESSQHSPLGIGI